MRLHGSGQVVGTAQASIRAGVASLAWVVGTRWQGRGFGSEAAAAVASWARGSGLRLRAAVHPDHVASAGVARALGLQPTDERDEGEIVWRSPERSGPRLSPPPPAATMWPPTGK